MTFKLIKEKVFEKNGYKLFVFEHEKTKATHYHIEKEGEENAFMVTFKTLPQSDNGVAHILEHSVLCGSDNFPSKNLFFALRGKNMDTYMNAYTELDATSYPFATIDKDGFFNLLKVYLDVTFFPKLEKKIFLQEGWRYVNKGTKEEKKLGYSGVVYNEMIGHTSSQDNILFKTLLKHTLTGTQYETYSGGMPCNIPDLSYEEFVQFHKDFYHPSNAIFFTFGTIPVNEIHDQLETLVLSKFTEDSTQKINNKVQKLKEKYIETHPGESGAVTFMGWRLPAIKDVSDIAKYKLFSAIINNGKTNIRDYFKEKYPNGEVVCEGQTLVDYGSSPLIISSFKSTVDMSEEIKETFNEYFKKLLSIKLDKQEIENIFDGMDFSLRMKKQYVKNEWNSIFMKLKKAHFLNIKNPEEIINLDGFYDLKESFLNIDYFKEIVESLVSNKNFINITSVADNNFSKNIINTIEENLSKIQASLKEEDWEKIESEDSIVKQNIKSEDDESILPVLDLKSISIPDEKGNLLTENNIGGARLFKVEDDKLGITNISLYFPINCKDKNQLCDYVLLADLINDLNLNKKTIEETTYWKNTKIQNLSAQISFSNNNNVVNAYLNINGSCLVENTKILIDKFKVLMTEIDFKNNQVIKNIIDTKLRDFNDELQDNAMNYAILFNKSKVDASSMAEKIVEIDFYKEYLPNIVLSSKIDELNELYKSVFSYFNLVNVYSSKEAIDLFVNSFRGKFKDDNIDNKLMFEKEKNENNIIDIGSEVNFISSITKVGDVHKKETVSLGLIANVSSDYLIKNIRQIGGAYGASMTYDRISGYLMVNTYRDPNDIKSINIINKLIESVSFQKMTQREIDVKKIALVKTYKERQCVANFDLAKRQFSNMVNHRNFYEKIFIDYLIKLKVKDFRSDIKKYIENVFTHSIISNDSCDIKDFNKVKFNNNIVKPKMKK